MMFSHVTPQIRVSNCKKFKVTKSFSLEGNKFVAYDNVTNERLKDGFTDWASAEEHCMFYGVSSDARNTRVMANQSAA